MHAMQQLFERVFATLTRQSTDVPRRSVQRVPVSQTNKLTGAFENWDTVVWVAIPDRHDRGGCGRDPGVRHGLRLGARGAERGLHVAGGGHDPHDGALNVAEAQAANRMTGFLADVTTNIGAVKAYGAGTANGKRPGGGSPLEGVVLRRHEPVPCATARGYAGISTTINVAAVVAAVLAASQDAVSIPASTSP